MSFNDNTKLILVAVLVIGIIYFIHERQNTQSKNVGRIDQTSSIEQIATKTATSNTEETEETEETENTNNESRNRNSRITRNTTITPKTIKLKSKTNNSSNTLDKQYDSDLINRGKNNGVTGIGGDFGSNLENNDEVNTDVIDSIKKVQNKQKKGLELNATEYLPKEIGVGGKPAPWQILDVDTPQEKIENDKLLVVDKYIPGINTVGQTLKLPNLQLRPNPLCPKHVVSPWNNSTVPPTLDIKPLC